MSRSVRITLICMNPSCAASFAVPQHRIKTAKFCSYHCGAIIGMANRHPKTLAERFWQKVVKGEPGECWVWTAAKNTYGYGCMRVPEQDRNVGAHIISWFLHYGTWPIAPLWVLHTCDNPPCVNPAHLWLGTHADNMQDMVSKGRQGAYMHPERVARGNRHSSRTHPERVARGERNGARTHPERLSRGDSHYSRTHPELLARGKRNGAHTHPERVNRGERVGTAKLTDTQWKEILTLYATGYWTMARLGALYGVHASAIGYRMKRAHIPAFKKGRRKR